MSCCKWVTKFDWKRLATKQAAKKKCLSLTHQPLHFRLRFAPTLFHCTPWTPYLCSCGSSVESFGRRPLRLDHLHLRRGWSATIQCAMCVEEQSVARRWFHGLRNVAPISSHESWISVTCRDSYNLTTRTSGFRIFDIDAVTCQDNSWWWRKRFQLCKRVNGLQLRPSDGCSLFPLTSNSVWHAKWDQQLSQ